MIKNYIFQMCLGENTLDDSLTRTNVQGKKLYTKLNTDKAVWDEVAQKAVEFGFNAVLIELADGVKYKSHPEIAVEGAWEVEELRKELNRLREMGLTPYPKLNFSTAHDAWLKVYSRMVSTKKYYEVARDLIHEVIDIFDTPEMFNLGLDDENSKSQVRYDYVCYRQYELYWHDYKFFLDCVKEKGVRPWVAIDPYVMNKEKFVENTDKDVVVSVVYNGWYFEDIYATLPSPTDNYKNPNYDPYTRLQSFTELPKLGYDIIPTCPGNVRATFEYVQKNLSENDKVQSIMVAPPCTTVPAYKFTILQYLNTIRLGRKDI